jgi:hypothetical protein
MLDHPIFYYYFSSARGSHPRAIHHDALNYFLPKFEHSAEIHIILSPFHHENSCFPRDAKSSYSQLPPLFIFHFLSIHSQPVICGCGISFLLLTREQSRYGISRNADDRLKILLCWGSQLFSIGEQSTGKINFAALRTQFKWPLKFKLPEQGVPGVSE